MISGWFSPFFLLPELFKLVFFLSLSLFDGPSLYLLCRCSVSVWCRTMRRISCTIRLAFLLFSWHLQHPCLPHNMTQIQRCRRIAALPYRIYGGAGKSIQRKEFKRMSKITFCINLKENALCSPDYVVRF